MFGRKSLRGSARDDSSADDPRTSADVSGGWSDDWGTPERSGRPRVGTLTRGAVRRHAGDASLSLSPSSVSIVSAGSTPTQARSVSTDRWRVDALEHRSEQMLAEDTREAREVYEFQEHVRVDEEKEKRKRAGVLGKLRSTSSFFVRSKKSNKSVDDLASASSKAATDLTDKTSTVSVGLSALGPHPSELKRITHELPSMPVEDVPKTALALLPKRGPLREGTKSILRALQVSGFEVVEHVVETSEKVSDDSRMTQEEETASTARDGLHRLSFLKEMLTYGVVVNGLETVNKPTWKNLHAARVAGVIVMNYDCPLLFSDMNRYVDVGTLDVPKQLPPYSVDLKNRCSTGPDGYREVIVHVIASNNHEAERAAMRHWVLPRLVERCRTRRVRPVFIDLKSNAAGCGVGHALRTADITRDKASIHVVLTGGTHEPEKYANERLKRFIDKIPRGGARERYEWLAKAPSDYSRNELVTAHILRLHERPSWMQEEERQLLLEKQRVIKEKKKMKKKNKKTGAWENDENVNDGTQHSDTTSVVSKSDVARSYESLQSSVVSLNATANLSDTAPDVDSVRQRVAAKRALLQTEQHVLAYVRRAGFSESIPGGEYETFFSEDPFERERCASFLSTMYAHPNVSVVPYDCVFAKGTEPGKGFVSGVPAHAADLQKFSEKVLDDIWARISYEFPSEPSKDITTWHERQPEFALNAQLPFYFNRGTTEHTVVRCVKLGRPGVVCVGGVEGSGITSLFQRCARETRRLFGNVDGTSRDDVCVLSVFSDVGHAQLTPLDVFLTLTQQLSAWRETRGIVGASKFSDGSSSFDSVPSTLNACRSTFLEMARVTVGPTRRVAVFLDNVTSVKNPLGLAWLPHELEIPSGLQFIVGTRARDDTLQKSLRDDHRCLLTKSGVVMHAADRVLRTAHTQLAQTFPDSYRKTLTLRQMTYAERKSYVAKHVETVLIELEEITTACVLAIPHVAHLPYANLLVEHLVTLDLDAMDTSKYFEKVETFPGSMGEMLLEKLSELETIFPAEILSLVLPAVALGENVLTIEDISAIIETTLDDDLDDDDGSNSSAKYLDTLIVPVFLHAARHFVSGPFDGTFRVTSDAAKNAILMRYASDERTRIAAYRMLAEYYGDLDAYADGDDGNNSNARSRRSRRQISPGFGLLKRFHNLSPDSLATNSDAVISNRKAFQEHHLVCDAIALLPFYLTKAKRFGELCSLLKDFSWITSKIEMHQLQSLLFDFDRVLKFPQPPWIKEWDSGDCAPGSRDYFVAKKVAEQSVRQFPFGSLDLHQYDAESFRRWMGDSFGNAESQHGDVVSCRHLVWRNLKALVDRPNLLLQIAMNAPGESEPGGAAEELVRTLSPPSAQGAYVFADAQPGTEFLLLWGNRPDEAPSREFCDASTHDEPVTIVRWIDDACFVTGAENGLVSLWSAQTGECAAKLFGHERAVTDIAVVGGGGYASEKQNNQNENASSRTFSNHGVRVVTSSKDGTVRVWHVERDLGNTCDVLVHERNDQHNHESMYHTNCSVNALAYSQNAAELLSAGDDGCVVCWDMNVRSGPPRRLRSTETSHVGPILSLACNYENSVFITGGMDKTLQVWSSESSGSNLLNDGAEGTVLSGAASSISAATRWRRRAAGKDDAVSFNNFTSHNQKNAPEQVLKLIGHLADVTCVAFGKVEKQDSSGSFYSSIASGSLDHSVMLWNVETGVHVGMLTGHTGPVVDVQYTKDSKLLLSSSRDQTTRVWRPKTGQVILELNHLNPVGSAQLSPDASRLLAGTDSGSVAVWGWLGRVGSASMGQWPQRPNLFAKGHPVRELESGSAESKSKSHQTTKTGKIKKPNPFAFDGQAHRGPVTSIASFDHMSVHLNSKSDELLTTNSGREVAAQRVPCVSSGRDGFLRLISGKRDDAGKVVSSFTSGHVHSETVAVNAVDASPEGTRTLAAMHDGTVVEWDVVTGLDRVKVKAHGGAVRSVRYATGLNSLGTAFTGGDDKCVRVWDLREEGKAECLTHLTGHSARVTGIGIGEGDLLVTASSDRTALVWDVSKQKVTQSLIGHTGGLTDIKVTEGAGLIVTTSIDNTVKCWDTRNSSGKEVWSMKCASTPQQCAATSRQPNWFGFCGADGARVIDVRVWREVAYFAGLAPITAIVFHGESKLFLGDTDGRMYALDVWKAPPRSW